MTMVPDQPNELILTESRTMRAGHVYAVQFSTGVVKVGQTRQLKARLADHAKTAQAHGHTVHESLLSPPHTNYLANEAALIAFCSSRGTLIAGREYFEGCDMQEVAFFFGELTITPPTNADKQAAAVLELRERLRRARQLDRAEPFADEILRVAKHSTQLGLDGAA